MTLPWDGYRVGVSAPPLTRARLIGQVLLALLSVIGIDWYRYAKVWTPLQRRYLPAYVRSAVAITPEGSYDVLQVVLRKGTRLAREEDLVAVPTATVESSFALTDAAMKAGAVRLTWQAETYDHATLHAWLGLAIYQDQTLLDLAKPALVGGLGVFLTGLVLPLLSGVARVRAARRERHASGLRTATAPRAPWPPTADRSVVQAHVASRDRPFDWAPVAVPVASRTPSNHATPAQETTRPRNPSPPRPPARPRPFFE